MQQKAGVDGIKLYVGWPSWVGTSWTVCVPAPWQTWYSSGESIGAYPFVPRIPMMVHNGVVYRPGGLLAAVEQSLEDESWAIQSKRHWERRTGKG